MKNQSTPGKVMLFGEYTILFNQRAIAVPINRYSGAWSFHQNNSLDEELNSWLKYLQGVKKNEVWLKENATTSFEQDLKIGMYFQSNIPRGYGLGSSGALVAAWYRRYIDQSDELELSELKKRLATLESYFHGTSSGFDPVVSFLKGPVLHDQINFSILDSNSRIPLLKEFFLLDTKIPRSTEQLVKLFMQKCNDEHFAKKLLPQLIDSQSFAMDAFILSDLETLKDEFFKISKFQFDHLPEFIPEEIKVIWKKGLESKDYLLKLCGAGGGGCMLGIGKIPEVDFSIFPVQVKQS